MVSFFGPGCFLAAKQGGASYERDQNCSTEWGLRCFWGQRLVCLQLRLCRVTSSTKNARFSSGREHQHCLKNEASYVRSEAPRGCQDSQPCECQHADWSGIGLDLLWFTLWARVFQCFSCRVSCKRKWMPEVYAIIFHVVEYNRSLDERVPLQHSFALAIRLSRCYWLRMLGNVHTVEFAKESVAQTMEFLGHDWCLGWVGACCWSVSKIFHSCSKENERETSAL